MITPDGPAKYGSTVESSFTIVNILLLLYSIGFLASLSIFLFRMRRLYKLLRTNNYQIINGFKIFHIDNSPVFSFFNYIFMDKTEYSNFSESEKILAHESFHINEKHTIDLLLTEFLVIVQWFNPFAYLLRKRVKENHEFIADNSVIRLYPDRLAYSKLIVDRSSIIKTNILTHNFSYSLLKRRLFMIRKPKTPYLFSLKLIWVAMALTLVVFACSSPAMEPDSKVNSEKSAEVFTVVEQMPEYPGGMEALSTYLSENIKYPQSAKDAETEGKSFIRFVIDEDGSVTDVKVQRGFNDDCDAEALRVVSQMPNWVPGKQRGKSVKVEYTLPISFVLDEKPTEVFTVVEVMPSFPGGRDKLMTYLSENIKYPNEAKKNKVEGRVFVSFVVEKDGTIDDVKILRGIGSGCDKESIRVIENMPKWTPGTQRGKAVRVAFNLPIMFKLS